jgi:hypothetical protein
MNSLTDKQIDELLTDKQIDKFLEFLFFDWYYKAKAAGTHVYDGAEDKKMKAFFFGYGDLTTKELVTMIGSLGKIPGEVCQLTELQIAELKAKILGWEKYASCTMTVNDLGHFLQTLGGQTPKSIPFEVEEPAPAEDDSAGSFNSPRNRNVTNRAPDQPSSPEEDFSTWKGFEWQEGDHVCACHSDESFEFFDSYVSYVTYVSHISYVSVCLCGIRSSRILRADSGAAESSGR